MDLKYKTLPINEAGTAVQGCGTIHISEIQTTLTKLSDELGFPFDLNDYTVGSTGKTEKTLYPPKLIGIFRQMINKFMNRINLSQI